MTRDRNKFRDDVSDDDGSGLLTRFLAEEEVLDKRSMWRLASWGAGSIGLLVIAILATRSPAAIQRNQLASSEIARQFQQVQWIAKESQNKARELAAAVETLNGDRDRLYARVTILEQGLDSVTGSLNRSVPVAATPVAAPSAPVPLPSAAAPAPEADLMGPLRRPEAKADSPAPPVIASVATAPAAQGSPAETVERKTVAPTVEPASAPAMTAAIPPADAERDATPPSSVVRRTEFGIDLGGANSIEGLRAVWRGAVGMNSERLASMQPIIVVKERNDGLGMQLRLVAGPLSNAAEAAKVCAGLLANSNRPCETAVYEGQRLSMANEKAVETPAHRPKRRAKSRAEPVVEEKPKTSSFSSFFNNN